MKRLLAIVIGLAAIAPGLAIAQSNQTPTLVDVAKAEEARRKGVRKPAKVYTNDNLKSDFSVGVPPAPATPAASAAAGNSSSTTVPAINIPGGPAPATPAAPEMRDQAYWSGRITAARAAIDRSRLFADSLQTRINALTTDFVNRDDPVQKAKIEGDRKAALAELEKVRKEIESQQKEIAAIEDEARRAGVPSGWLRPGA